MAIPDIIDLLQSYLDGGLTEPVATRVPDPMPAAWLQIRRVGGGKLPPVRDKARIDLIAWADDEPTAMDLLSRARVLVTALAVPGGNLTGTPVYRVEETMGPRQADDKETGKVQAWATVAITYRADDLIR